MPYQPETKIDLAKNLITYPKKPDEIVISWKPYGPFTDIDPFQNHCQAGVWLCFYGPTEEKALGRAFYFDDFVSGSENPLSSDPAIDAHRSRASWARLITAPPCHNIPWLIPMAVCPGVSEKMRGKNLALFQWERDTYSFPLDPIWPTEASLVEKMPKILAVAAIAADALNYPKRVKFPHSDSSQKTTTGRMILWDIKPEDFYTSPDGLVRLHNPFTLNFVNQQTGRLYHRHQLLPQETCYMPTKEQPTPTKQAERLASFHLVGFVWQAIFNKSYKSVNYLNKTLIQQMVAAKIGQSNHTKKEFAHRLADFFTRSLLGEPPLINEAVEVIERLNWLAVGQSTYYTFPTQ